MKKNMFPSLVSIYKNLFDFLIKKKQMKIREFQSYIKLYYSNSPLLGNKNSEIYPIQNNFKNKETKLK